MASLSQLDLIPTQELLSPVTFGNFEEIDADISGHCSSVQPTCTDNQLILPSLTVENTEKNDKSGRFSNVQPASSSQLQAVLKDSIPKRTIQNNNWALKVFKQWRMWRQFQSVTQQDQMWPIPSLESGTKVIFSCVLIDC